MIGNNWGSVLDTRLAFEPDGGARVMLYGGLAWYAYASPPMAPAEHAEVIEQLTRAACAGKAPDETAAHRRRLTEDRAFLNAEWRRWQALVPARTLAPATPLRRRTQRHACDQPACEDAYLQTLVRTEAGYEERGLRGERVWYNAAGHFIGSRDQHGNTDRLVWQPDRRSAVWSDDAGHALRFTLDPAGLVTGVEDERKHRVAYRYNQRGELVAVLNHRHRITGYDYDDGGLHRIVAMGDGYGVTRIAYEAVEAGGRARRVTGPEGVTFEWQYETGAADGRGDPGGPGSVLRWKVTRTRTTPGTQPEVSRSEFTVHKEPGAPDWVAGWKLDAEERRYNRDGRPEQLGDERFTYDAEGRLAGRETPLAVYAYTQAPGLPRVDRVTRTLKRKGSPVAWATYTYDIRGNPKTYRDSLGGKVAASFDAKGRPVKLQDERLRTVELVYGKEGTMDAAWLTRPRSGRCGLRLIHDEMGELVDLKAPQQGEAAYPDDLFDALNLMLNRLKPTEALAVGP